MGIRAKFVILVCFVMAAGLPVVAQAPSLQELSRELAALVRNANPSVVEIQSTRSGGLDPIEEPLQGGARIVVSSTRRAVGSGFVIDEAGYILTTGSVVADADSITVKFPDGSEADAKLLGVDPLTDAAVVKVDKAGLKALDLGDSDSLEPGGIVVTINSQAGMTNSASLGIVSGVNRKVGSSALDLIQVSGAVGPGASGGPVLDPSGRVVGVTTAMLSPSFRALPFNLPSIFVAPRLSIRPDSGDVRDELDELLTTRGPQHPLVIQKKHELERTKRQESEDLLEAQKLLVQAFGDLGGLESLTAAVQETTRTAGSIGFAIPINSIKPVLDALKSGKSIKRGWLGLSVSEEDGRIVLRPSPGSPAEKAGVKAGDVLIKVDGRSFESASDFARYVASLAPGGTITLLVKRDGKEIEIKAKLGERPSVVKPSVEQMSISIPDPFKLFTSRSIDLDNAGIAEVAKAVSKAFGKNVIVTDPQKIQKRVTVHLKSTTVEDALDTICRAMGCTYRKDGDTYIISPK